MNILAIDQSTSSSGWCYLADGVVQEYGVIKTPKAFHGLGAALWQCQQLLGVAARYEGLQAIAIEDLYLPGMHSNVKTLTLLGALRGMLVLIAHQNGWQWQTVTSPEICEHLGIRVNTPRPQKKRASRQIAAMELFGCRTRYQEIPEDAADAIAIAEIAERKLTLLEKVVV